ncbi:hypothetical protein ACFSYD_25080 [Paracoccus aerius]
MHNASAPPSTWAASIPIPPPPISATGCRRLAAGDEIDAPAAARIHAEARGVPRMINKIADLALVYGAAADRQSVGADIVDELIRDGLILTAAPEPTLPERPARLVLAHEQEVKRDAT